MTKLTHIELGVINYALSIDKEGKQRKFAFSELGLVSSISKKLLANVKDNMIPAGEYDLDLSTEEKVKIMEAVKEMTWGVGDAEMAISVVDKLK